MSAAVVVEILLILGVFVGLPVLCYFDPAGLGAAEARRRAEES